MFRHFFLTITIASCLLQTALAVPRINEISAAGQSLFRDEDNATPDWLEIHNPDADAVQLGGWHLSDREGAIRKWTFPAVTLQPGGYLVVFASGKNRKRASGELHTNFGLGSGGGQLTLARPDGTVVQTMNYPVQIPDVSWDGTRFLSNPTPGLANDPTEEPVTHAPTFSQPRGFQSLPFDLSLTSSTPGAAIFYTLDGSEPTPASLRYTGPLRISKTTVIRAVAAAASNDLSPLTARTFLFAADIVKQSPGGGAPKGWPKTWGDNRVDYGMDPAITGRAPYKGTIANDLRAVPSFSVIMSLNELFDPSTGIYANPFSKGREWERPMSLEYIEPTGGGGFEIPGGIRIRGGASRDPGNPKHSFQFRFRKEYGASHLDYPLLGEDGPERTDAFDLRWDHLVSWHYTNDVNSNQLQDIFGRDSQLAANGVAKRGHLCNLYINGQYWGLFYIDERVNGDYGANHFGGSPEDYDIIRFDPESGGPGLDDGSRRAWREAYDLGAAGFESNERYFRALGRNPDGTRNPGYEKLIDEENLIDYMLVGIWCGATDNPVVFGTENNWSSIRSRKGDFGFRFFVHDFELSMFDVDGNFIGGNPTQNELAAHNSENVNPWHFWMALRTNAEFRLKVADRVQKHFFNGGALTSEACVARWNARMQEMDRAIVAESARWGDSQGGAGLGPVPVNPVVIDPGVVRGPVSAQKRRRFTRNDWVNAATAKRDEYVSLRSEKMLQHLKDGELFPSTQAPVFSQFGGALPVGGTVELSNPNSSGTIYFTLNGGDPRLVGGAVAPDALTYAGPISLLRDVEIRARVRDGENWSALVKADFAPGVNYGGLRITEIHYNPKPSGAEAADDAEFIELKNTGTTALDLSGCVFTEGITYTFPAGTSLAPGAFYVIARNATVFSQKHPGLTPDGVFAGKLGDDGESFVLTNAAGTRIFALDYDDESPWPLAPDGFGPSLVYDGNGNPDDGKNWRASSVDAGSPGQDDGALPHFGRVVVNEVLGQTSGTPFIEIHNPEPFAADISNWRLGADRALPAAKIFDPGTVIPPGGYLVVEPATGMPVLDAEGGAVFLYSVPAGYAHECRYGPLENEVAAGLHINSDGERRFVAMPPTRGARNAAPIGHGALRISEVLYRPIADPALDFVEIENTGSASVPLAGLRVSGMNFVFPAGATIDAGARVVVTSAGESAFRAAFDVHTIPVFGPSAGNLQDNGERVALEEPVGAGWKTLDEVRYNDRYPWPFGPAGAGESLHRLPAVYGDESAAWTHGAPTPGDVGADGRPRVAMTSPGDQLVTTAGATIALGANASDPDGTIAKVEFLVDGRVVGEDDAAPYAFNWFAEPGTHDLSTIATDSAGNTAASLPVVIYAKGDESSGPGIGLKAEFFANPNLEGTPVERVAETLIYDWSAISPADGIPLTGFSARFSGRILPRKTGSHTLVFHSAGGLRVTVNGETVIDAWNEPDVAPGERWVSLIHEANFETGVPVELVVEYFDTDGCGVLEMLMKEPGAFSENLVSQGQFAYPGQDVSAFGISTPAELPGRRLGQPVRQSLATLNGAAPVQWRIVNGAIPDGIVLGKSGSLNGVATEGGKFAFTLEAEDASGAKSQRQFRILITTPATRSSRYTVEVTRPTHDSQIGVSPFNAAGRVTGGDVMMLEYSLNGAARRAVPPAADWSFVIDKLRGLTAGSNNLRVFATDSNGREAASALVFFRYRYPSDLNVSIAGSGTVTAGYLGTTTRYVGDMLDITARPAPGWIFARWEPDLRIESTPRIRPLMADDLSLTAVFVKNPFGPFAGSYVGLVGEGRRLSRYHLLITPSGAFTMALEAGGSRVVKNGRLSSEGNFTSFQDEGPNLPNALHITLAFDSSALTIRTQYFGVLGFEEFTSTAFRANWDRNCPAAGRWTAAAVLTDPSLPGHTYVTMQIRRNGFISFAGHASDGSPISGGTQMANEGLVPFYTPLKGGSISGLLHYTSQSGLRFNSNLAWYTDTLSTALPIEVVPYVVPTSGSVISLASGLAQFSDVDPDLLYESSVRLTSGNRFVFANPGAALPVLSVHRASGLLKGSIVLPGGGARVQLRGVVNQVSGNAAGIRLSETPGGFSINPIR